MATATAQRLGSALAVVLALAGCGHNDSAGTDRPANAGTSPRARGADAPLSPGVVAISARIGRRDIRSSGTVVDGDRGLVVTSAHSVWGASSLKLATDVAVVHGRIVARSPCDDLALVQAQPWVPGLVALPQRAAPIGSARLRSVRREWDADGVVGAPARAAGSQRADGRQPAIAHGVRLAAGLPSAATGGPLLDGDGRVVAIAAVTSGGREAVAVPMRRVRARLDDLRPGHGTVYVGWSKHFRCAPRQQAYAASHYPGFRARDGRLNRPVPASRLPGTAGVDG